MLKLPGRVEKVLCMNLYWRFQVSKIECWSHQHQSRFINCGLKLYYSEQALDCMKWNPSLSKKIVDSGKNIISWWGLVNWSVSNTVVCRSFRQCARQSDTPYLCHFATEMAEIWSPATSYQDVFAYKISALYHLYFQSYETFSEIH